MTRSLLVGLAAVSFLIGCAEQPPPRTVNDTGYGVAPQASTPSSSGVVVTQQPSSVTAERPNPATASTTNANDKPPTAPSTTTPSSTRGNESATPAPRVPEAMPQPDPL